MPSVGGGKIENVVEKSQSAAVAKKRAPASLRFNSLSQSAAKITSVSTHCLSISTSISRSWYDWVEVISMGARLQTRRAWVRHGTLRWAILRAPRNVLYEPFNRFYYVAINTQRFVWYRFLLDYKLEPFPFVHGHKFLLNSPQLIDVTNGALSHYWFLGSLVKSSLNHGWGLWELLLPRGTHGASYSSRFFPQAIIPVGLISFAQLAAMLKLWCAGYRHLSVYLEPLRRRALLCF